MLTYIITYCVSIYKITNYLKYVMKCMKFWIRIMPRRRRYFLITTFIIPYIWNATDKYLLLHIRCILQSIKNKISNTIIGCYISNYSLSMLLKTFIKFVCKLNVILHGINESYIDNNELLHIKMWFKYFTCTSSIFKRLTRSHNKWGHSNHKLKWQQIRMANYKHPIIRINTILNGEKVLISRVRVQIKNHNSIVIISVTG